MHSYAAKWFTDKEPSNASGWEILQWRILLVLFPGFEQEMVHCNALYGRVKLLALTVQEF